MNPNNNFNTGARPFIPRAGASSFVPGSAFVPPQAMQQPMYPPQMQILQHGMPYAPAGMQPQQQYYQQAPPQMAMQAAAPVPAPAPAPVSSGPTKLIMTGKLKLANSKTDAAKAEVKAEAPKEEPKVEAKAETPKVSAPKVEKVEKAPAPAAAAPAPAPAAEEEPKAAAAAAPAAAAESADAAEDSGAPKKKGIPAEFKVHDEREHLNIVFIGHVDAGKSTTCGNMLVLTGSVDERTIAKYEREAKEKNRESWYLAYVMDTNEEERAKGKTVEVGRAHFATAAKRYTILDAPGHKNYVPNMVVGAAQADIGVLIVSARKGEFESGFEKGGQTREHAMLAKTLGVQTLVVAINKMDDPTINWDKGRYDEIEAKVSPFLKTCGYNLKRDVVYMPVSGLTGANLIEPVSTAVCPWAQGPSLLQLLDGLKPLARDANAPLRLPIVDRYKEMGVLHVNGKVESGTLARGAKIIIMPAKLTTEVTAILVDEVEVDMVRPGENVLLKLKSLEEEDLHQGYVICPYDNPCKKTQVFDALISVLELLPHKPILSAGYTAVLHVHSLIAEVVIADMLTQTDKKTGIVSKKKPTFCRSGDLVTCRIQVEMPIAVEPFKDVQQLGRFTLRDEGKTIGMGKILKLVDSVDSAVDSSM